MIFKVIESVNHLCILLAIMKCVDDFPEKTLIEAQLSNTAQVKRTPREQESCTVPEATDPLAERNLLLGKRKKKEGTSTHDRTNGQPGRHSVLSLIDIKTRDGNSQDSQSENLQRRGLPPTGHGQYVISNPRVDEASDAVTASGALTTSKDQPNATQPTGSLRTPRQDQSCRSAHSSLKVFLTWTS